MKTIKIDEIEISNESKICFFAGLNILETSELAKEVAFNLKGITEKPVSYTHLTLPTRS